MGIVFDTYEGWGIRSVKRCTLVMGIVFNTHVSEVMVFCVMENFPLVMGTIFRTRVSRNSLLGQLGYPLD